MLSDIYITPHTLDRFRVHNPDADASSLRFTLNMSLEIDCGVVSYMLAKEHRLGRNPSQYFVAPNNRGLFVVEFGERGSFVKTYLRLYLTDQQTFVSNLWPSDHPSHGLLIETQPTMMSITQILKRNQPAVGVMLHSIKILPQLAEHFGSKNKARVALLHARSVPTDGRFDHVLVPDCGVHVAVHYSDYRWLAGILDVDEVPEFFLHYRSA